MTSITIGAYEMSLKVIKMDILATIEAINYKLKMNERDETIDRSELNEFPNSVNKKEVDQKLYELYYALSRLEKQLQKLNSSLEEEDDYSSIISC